MINAIALLVMNYRTRIPPRELIMVTSWLLDVIWKTALCAAHKENEHRALIKLPQRHQRVNAPSRNKNMQQISAWNERVRFFWVLVDLQVI